jgi:hypothetical protein
MPPLTNPPARPRSAVLDTRHVERAAAMIVELGDDLDRHLEDETRPSERMRLLREATNRITRTANDAVQAYRRARRALDAELRRPSADVDAVNRLGERLTAARDDVLAALDAANARYPHANSGAGDEPSRTDEHRA